MRIQTPGTLLLTDARLMPNEASDALSSVVRRINQFFQSITRRAAQISCGLTGHAALLRYESRRLSLQCTHCGHESPGWDLCVAERDKK